ncbi:MAG: AbrB/MazE/SpoVT family DNA-binding domain-containing protein, partial [Caldilineales bacterium]|nr:AbrB/MazE/SpoVT family DNA-binding domain-containing protein [Caldilineales bacterium]
YQTSGSVLQLFYCSRSIRRCKTMDAITTISAKYQIVIPRPIREQFLLRPGQRMMFIPYQKSMRLVIVPSIEEARGMFQGIDADNLREEAEEDR